MFAVKTVSVGKTVNSSKRSCLDKCCLFSKNTFTVLQPEQSLVPNISVQILLEVS